MFKFANFKTWTFDSFSNSGFDEKKKFSLFDWLIWSWLIWLVVWSRLWFWYDFKIQKW